MGFVKTGDDMGMNILDPDDGVPDADNRKCLKCGRTINSGEEHGECEATSEDKDL